MARGLGALGADANVFDLELGERVVNGVEANGAIDEFDVEGHEENIREKVLGLVPIRKPLGLMGIKHKCENKYDFTDNADIPRERSSAGRRIDINDLM